MKASFIRNLQSEQQKQVLAKIEQLRVRKERCKQAIARLQTTIIDTDIAIRELRQSLPTLASIEIKPRNHKETLEEQLARLIKEENALREQLANRRMITNG